MKGLAGEVLCTTKNESVCALLWYVRPPTSDLRGPPVVEISAKIQIQPWVQTPMKAFIYFPMTKMAILLYSWTWWWINWCKGYWGTTSTHECGRESAHSVFLLLHVDENIHRTINPGPGFSPVRASCCDDARSFLGWRIRWIYSFFFASWFLLVCA